MTDIIAFQAGREARIADKPRDARRNADWLHGWVTVDMQERLTRSMTPTPTRTQPMANERCRDCALYDLQAVLSKNGRVLSGRAARCLWVSTEEYPASMSFWAKRPKPGYMEPNSGAGCPCFTPKGHPNA